MQFAQLGRLSRLAVAASLAIGCGGPHSSGTTIGNRGAPSGVERWFPTHPVYLASAHTVRDAQRTARDLADSLGMAFGGAAAFSHSLAHDAGFDPLDPAALIGLGIDLDGSVALFSDGIWPTLVVHLSAPEALAAFIDHRREKGMVTKSVVVDGVEVFTTGKHDELTSWAIAGDWLWLHINDGTEAGPAWFTDSHGGHPGGNPDWAWATAGVKATATTGFLQLGKLANILLTKGHAALECGRLLAPIGRISASVDGDGHHVGGAISVELGTAAAALASHVLPIPAGWDAAAGSAAVAVQWNLDTAAIHDALEPCARALGGNVDMLTSFGIRAGRAALLSFSPDGPSGTGAISLDLSSRRWPDMLLSNVPGRSLLERDHKFGVYAGHTLSVPFVGSVDYVLNDTVALAGVGDGVLAQVAGQGGPVAGPIASIDINTSGLPAAAWKSLLQMAGMNLGDTVVSVLMGWHGGHIGVRLDHDRLVIEAHGDRR